MLNLLVCPLPPLQALLKQTHRMEKQLAHLAQALGPTAVAALNGSDHGSEHGDHGTSPPIIAPLPPTEGYCLPPSAATSIPPLSLERG